MQVRNRYKTMKGVTPCVPKEKYSPSALKTLKSFAEMICTMSIKQRSLQTCSGIMGMQICLPVPGDSANTDHGYAENILWDRAGRIAVWGTCHQQTFRHLREASEQIPRCISQLKGCGWNELSGCLKKYQNDRSQRSKTFVVLKWE